ncbi:MAG: PQQ-binding-like beta-propeller repeat protein [Planctomyces sp.]
MSLSCLLIAVTSFFVGDSSWPGFLGTGRTEVDPSTIPVQWSPHENQAWSKTITGYGQSSPVIWNDFVYVTTVDGAMKDRLITTALRLSDGELIWEKFIDTSDLVQNGTFVSRAAPTPVVDQHGLVCFFESGDLVAYSHSGEELWKTSLSQKYGKFQNEYGLAASPVLFENLLILLIDHPGPSYVIALDRNTGEQIWKTDRTSRGSWSSPMIFDAPGGAQLLCSSAGTIDGYDLRSGQLLWTFDGVGGNRICSPMSSGEGAFLIGAQTSREFPDKESVKRSNFRMRVSKDGDQWKPEVIWRTEEASPGMASPIAHGGCSYWINRTGAVFCFDTETGKLHYTERIKQSPWATPFALGDRIYVFGKDGLTTVIAAGPAFQILAENQLWDPELIKPDQSIIDRETDPKRKAGAAMHTLPEVSGAAVVSGSLVLRTGNTVYCIRPENSAVERSGSSGTAEAQAE